MKNPTVLDSIVYLTSTAFTGEFLIIGSTLHEVMQLILADLSENSVEMFDKDMIFFDAPETIYLKEFYLEVWQKSVRPIVEKHLKIKYPNAWFLKLYTVKLNLA